MEKYGKVIVLIYINYGLCIYLYILYLIWDMGKLYKITIDNYGLVPLCAWVDLDILESSGHQQKWPCFKVPLSVRISSKNIEKSSDHFLDDGFNMF